MLVRVAHASLQYSDNNRETTADIEKIFRRARRQRYAWITGTESGPGAGNTSSELIRVGSQSGYRMWVPEHEGERTDCWIGVREDLILGNYECGFTPVIPGSKQLPSKDRARLKRGHRWGPKGVVHVSFDSLPELGHINVGAAHYIHGSRKPENPTWEWNQKLAAGIGEWAEEAGKGSALVTYGGDQNMADNKNDEPQGDTFFGEELTSTWDELNYYENTGHGVIDVIATYNRDKRVRAMSSRALDDKEFKLFMDHFLIEALLDIAPLKV